MKTWKKGAVIGGLIGFLFHTTVVWYFTGYGLIRKGINELVSELFRSTILGVIIGILTILLLIKVSVIEDQESRTPDNIIINNKWDYIVPFVLGTISIMLGLSFFLFIWGMRCEYPGACGDFPTGLVTLFISSIYILMFIFTRYAELKWRIIVFPFIGLLAVIIYFNGYVATKADVGNIDKLANIPGYIAFLGSGYFLGNLVLWITRRQLR